MSHVARDHPVLALRQQTGHLPVLGRWSQLITGPAKAERGALIPFQDLTGITAHQECMQLAGPDPGTQSARHGADHVADLGSRQTVL